MLSDRPMNPLFSTVLHDLCRQIFFEMVCPFRNREEIENKARSQMASGDFEVTPLYPFAVGKLKSFVQKPGNIFGQTNFPVPVLVPGYDSAHNSPESDCI